MSLFAPTIGLDALTEKQWQHQLIGTTDHPGLARQLGYRVYHTLRSKGSQPGWPDWALCRERLVYLELKREDRRTSKLTPPQKDWLRALLHAGAEAYVVRPSDFQAIAEILACRGDPFQRRELADIAAQLRQTTLEEASR